MRRLLAQGLTVVVLGIFLVAIYSSATDLQTQQHVGCLGGSVRTVQQLVVDWSIYTADRKAAQKYAELGANATANKSLILSQGTIRRTEAQALLVATSRIAGVRIDVSYARYLPPPLAKVVRRANFTCPSSSVAVGVL